MRIVKCSSKVRMPKKREPILIRDLSDESEYMGDFAEEWVLAEIKIKNKNEIAFIYFGGRSDENCFRSIHGSDEFFYLEVYPEKEEVLKALRESINHWMDIVEEKEDVRCDSNECALCNMFSNEDNIINLSCMGCPIFKDTGKEGCNGTPYNDYNMDNNHVKFAKKELDYLIEVYYKIVIDKIEYESI